MRKSFVLVLGLAFANAIVVSGTATRPAFGQPAGAPVGADPLARAQAAVDAGESAEALVLVEPILKRDKKNARALLIRSTARCLDGDLEACTKDLDAALAADPKLRQGWLNRSALAIAGKRYDDALAALARAEELEPTAPDNGLNQGAVLLLQGQLEPATVQFRRYLERNANAPDAWYLIATNYAFSGYAALAVEHLARAIAVDERQRLRARVDPNFADLSANRSFQVLLTTDSWRAPAGSATASRTFRTRFSGTDSPILIAALNAIQLGGTRLLGSVEVTAEWALLWTDFRVKLSRAANDSTIVDLTAPAGAYTDATWQSRTQDFFTSLERELLRLELAKGRAAPPPSPS